MQRRQRIVFSNMGGFSHEEPQPIPVEVQNYLFNTTVFEIAANWDFVLDLMSRFHSGNIRSVDSLEKDWLNFCIGNHIDVNKYEDSDQFLNSWCKK